MFRIMNKFKKISIVVITFLISLFISSKLSSMIFYDYMFVVDMQDEGSYSLSNSYDNGVRFSLLEDGDYYKASIPKEITGYSIDFKIKLNESEKRIEEVYYNEKKLSDEKILKLTDYSKYEVSYENLPLFMIERDGRAMATFTLVITLLSTIIVSMIFFKKNLSISNLVYSNTFMKTLKKRDIIILGIVFLLTFFIVVGCDAIVIANAGNLFSEGIDMYQLQVNTRLLTGREFAEFPYNPIMLIAWGGILTIFRPITKHLPVIGNFPYFEVGIIKLFNLILIFLTISAVLSFLMDAKIVDKKRAKIIYYLALFNPITFYVAMLFVQLDTLTLFLVTVGTLLLNKLNEDNYLGILMLSLGLLLKMQILFLLPGAIIAILYIIFFCSKDKISTRILRMIKSGLIFSFIAISSFVLPYIMKTPFYHLEANLAQSERVWYTTIPYNANTFFFLALAALAAVTIYFVLNVHSNIKKEKMAIASIINYAVIIFMFSFAVLPTPSIYITTLGAFILIIALEKDILKNIILTLVSVLVIVCPMFADYGDISKIIKNPNETGFITSHIQAMEPEDSTRINSIMFTVSSVSMFTIGLYMQKKSVDLIKEDVK